MNGPESKFHMRDLVAVPYRDLSTMQSVILSAGAGGITYDHDR